MNLDQPLPAFATTRRDLAKPAKMLVPVEDLIGLAQAYDLLDSICLAAISDLEEGGYNPMLAKALDETRAKAGRLVRDTYRPKGRLRRVKAHPTCKS